MRLETEHTYIKREFFRALSRCIKQVSRFLKKKTEVYTNGPLYLILARMYRLHTNARKTVGDAWLHMLAEVNISFQYASMYIGAV